MSVARVKSWKPTFRFGVFEADVVHSELRKRGVRISLQEQPFRLLCALLERPGQVITREELRARIWPADTFVDFDGSLNIAALKVRQALGDSASHPRFVETVPRRGYRFIADVEHVDLRPANLPAEPAIAPERPSVPAEKLPWLASLVGRSVSPSFIGVVLACSLGAGWVYRYSGRAGTNEFLAPPVPLTSFSGYEANPSVSPDGRRVAFVWNGEKQDNFDVYVLTLPVRSGAPARLTSSPADDSGPVWSPDGQKIAFIRQSGPETGELLVIAATGGPEHKVADIHIREIGLKRILSAAWSPDGRWISTSHREPRDFNESIYAFSLTGERRKLTNPPQGYYGDFMPALSPDGTSLAFCRLAGFSTSDIYLLKLDPGAVPAGAPRSVTTAKRWSVHPVWVRDGRSILYVSSQHPETRHELRQVAVDDTARGGKSLLLPDDPVEISAGAGQFVYTRRLLETNIWRARLPGPMEPPAEPELFVSSTRADEKPAYSPDGARLAFVSKRSGSDEIWVAAADGSNPVRLTDFGGPLAGALNWSPDGQRLVFHARPEGQSDVFTIPAAGGSPVRLTSDPADDIMPSYSRDGRWIYFASRRAGEYGIWKMPAGGGAATQVTGTSGTKPVESFDGRTIYFHSWPEPDAILSVSPSGGRPVRVSGPHASISARLRGNGERHLLSGTARLGREPAHRVSWFSKA